VRRIEAFRERGVHSVEGAVAVARSASLVEELAQIRSGPQLEQLGAGLGGHLDSLAVHILRTPHLDGGTMAPFVGVPKPGFRQSRFLRQPPERASVD